MKPSDEEMQNVLRDAVADLTKVGGPSLRRDTVTAIKSESQLDIDFTAKVIAVPTRLLAGLVRGSDPIESQMGAVKQIEGRSALQRKILWILAECGPLNAADVERRVEFRNLSPSTVRKRISELKQAGEIVQRGRKDGMAEWDIAR